MITPIDRSQFSHWRIYLRYLMTTYFGENELRTLCFDLGVDYESLVGASKDGKVIALIQLMIRTGQIIKLVDYCNLQRPNLDWLQIRQEILDEMADSKVPDKGSTFSVLTKWAIRNAKWLLLALALASAMLYQTNAQTVPPILSPTPIPSSVPSTSAQLSATQPTPTQLAPRFFNFEACRTICDGTNATRIFSAETKEIYARWDYANIPSGARYERTWSMNGHLWIKRLCTWTGLSQRDASYRKTLKGTRWFIRWNMDSNHFHKRSNIAARRCHC